MSTTHRLTVVIQREDDVYVALCPELDIASQGDSLEHAKANLAEAVGLFFESAGPDEVRDRLRGDTYITSIEVAVG